MVDQPVPSVPPQNIYAANQPQPGYQPPVMGSSSSGSVTTPPPPRKQFPKKLLLAVLGFILFIVLATAGFRIYNLRKTADEAEIVWWGLWEEEVVVAPLIEEYQKDNPNIKITYVKQSPQDYRERLTNSLARGNGPDIFRIHNTWVPMFRQELDQVPPSFMSPAEFSQTFYPVMVSDLTSGTGFVGIPLGYEALTLFINEDIFSSEGKTPPRTWDDLRQTAIELTKKDELGVITRAGVALGRTENVDHWPEILALMMIQNRASLVNPEGERAEDALNFFTLFSRSDGVWDETLPPSTTAFAAGKLAMYLAPSWRVFEIKHHNPDLNFRAVSLPQLPQATPDQAGVTYATYWVDAVWSRSDDKPAAWDFLAFLSQRESLEKVYENSSKLRLFGQPFPRIDMAPLLTDHPFLGPIITEAPDALSWYLADRTFDGPTGINSQINKYYEDAINAVNSGISAERALVPVGAGVSQVLSQYGLVRP